MDDKEALELIEILAIPSHLQRYFWNDYNSFVNYFGSSEAFRILSSKDNIFVSVSGLEYPVSLRPSTSDIPTFRQVFIDEHYDADLGFNPETIVDAGGNIGLATLYFHRKYPTAKIISIEPELNNYQQLLANINSYNPLEAINRALWYENEVDLTILNPDSDAWGFQVGESEESSQVVRTISIPAILQRVEVIDLLKIDIEGAERALFENQPHAWLPFVKSIFIEIHDNIVPGTTDLIFRVFEEEGFQLTQSGHVLVFVKQ